MGTNGNSADPFQPGQLVDGRYRIEKRLNAGGAGVVYEAVHGFTGLRVALKALHNLAGDHPERMQAEARTLAEMRHPNIVQITDGGVSSGVVWFTMELLDGRTLREELNRRLPIGVDRALRIGVQIAEGVTAAHELEVIHRDLKPENVFLLRDDTVKVLDFGTSKINSKLRRSAELKTTDRFRLIGTQAYMPPERLKAERADARADIYALGHILYEMLTGRHCWSDGPGPLDLPNALELCMRQVYLPPAPLRDHAPDLPEEIERIVLRALAKDPRQRQPSMREMSADLRSALEHWCAEHRAEPGRSPIAASASAEPGRSPIAASASAEPVATTTEESPAPFSAPRQGLPRSASADIDNLLVFGALRFASTEPEPGDIERALRGVAAVESTRADCAWLLKEFVRLGNRGGPASMAEFRAALAAIGRHQGAQQVNDIIHNRNSIVKRGWIPGTTGPRRLSRAELALFAARLLDPESRLDAAESALVRLADAEPDVQALALSVLVAFARTAPATHPAPRGALMALLLGGRDDSELARSELAGFVLSASASEDGMQLASQSVTRTEEIPAHPAQPSPARGPSDEAPTRSSRAPLSPSAALTPTPAGVATPRPEAPVESPRASSRASPSPVRAPVVLAVAAAASATVPLVGFALRRPAPAAPAPAHPAVASSAPNTRPTTPTPTPTASSPSPTAQSPALPAPTAPSRSAAARPPSPNRPAVRSPTPPPSLKKKWDLPASGL